MTPSDFSVFLFDRIPQNRQFEDRLWFAADNLRANAKLKSNEYAAPLLGLFFLRYASNRFNAVTPQAEKEFAATQNQRNSEAIEDVYKRLCGFYLPEKARYETLLNLKGEDNAQQAVIDAMDAFETANKDEANPSANITLPKNDYRKIPDYVLRGVIGTISEVKVSEGDGFGKIYEYFLGKFAISEGQKGGEFYTPTSVVKLIVEVIEPFKTDARVFDPACGTGGMFVQSAKFVQQHTGVQQLSLYGQEQVTETANLGKLNLFVHGLKGDIRNVDSSLAAAAYQDEYADTEGKFDFVMANPPFNVDAVKVEAIGNHPLFATYGLPLSTAKTGKKVDAFSNANYLWISLFATALNEHGRAGFVMANSASDARGGEAEVRQRMVEAGLVDVMITLASNFFYTVTLPVTLWFFDRAKTDPEHHRHDQTLFIDARKIFHQVTRAHREFTQAQLLNLAAIVWLYRGETEKFAALRKLYEQARETWRNETVSDLREEERVQLGRHKTWRGLSAQQDALAESCRALGEVLRGWFAQVEAQLSDEAKAALNENAVWQSNVNALVTVTVEQLTDKTAINEISKLAEDAVTFADKQLRPEKDKTFTKADVRGALKRFNEARDEALFVLERIAYFDAQLQWLDSHFPDGVWRDVEGLCKIASRADIAEHQFSLNPGRYVGVSVEDDGMTAADFQEYLKSGAATLNTLNQEANVLQRLIAEDVQALFAGAKAEAAR